MSEEMEFFIFLLEQYAAHKSETADKVLKRWDEAGMTERIFSMYEQYHMEALENAFVDVDSLLATGRHAG